MIDSTTIPADLGFRTGSVRKGGHGRDDAAPHDFTFPPPTHTPTLAQTLKKTAQNLTGHRKYCERTALEDRKTVEIRIPIELLGMACMVYDRGEPVTVESDYIPRLYVEGTYL